MEVHQPSPHWRRLPYFSILPALIIYLVLCVGPSLATVFFSFTDVKGIPGEKWRFVGLYQYEKFFTSGAKVRDNRDALVRTVKYAVSVTLIQNAAGLLLALLLNKKPKGHLFHRTLIFMPIILGSAVIALMWRLVLNATDGPLQQLLFHFGTASGFLSSAKSALNYVILVQIWSFLGYSMVIFLTGLQTIPVELYEAGQIDGATPVQSFLHITYPLLAPTVTINVLLAVIGSLKAFDFVFLLTYGEFNTKTLGFVMYQTAFTGSPDQALAAAVSVVQFIMILTISSIFLAYLRRREVSL